MIIAIATNENHLNAVVDTHFGRCNWYCLFDTETRKSSFIVNPARHHPDKAGCEAADLLLVKNISLAIAGRFGSKVVDVFKRNNVQMVIPESQQTVSEIINQIK
ncbi:MAG: dinitrogenase iron-molybdenum cofactor biosynthesis protein [Bacteroidia bacterium]|nr:dinitrogenase iron-molybdenum cofactor biosynthesis protein [Bacteroidia bacterium]